MTRVKQRPLQEVAKEILKRYKEHEEMLIAMTSESAEEKEKQLGFLDVDVGMYSNEIERASAELDRHGHWIEEVDPEEDCWNEEVLTCSCCGEPIRVHETDNTYFLPTRRTLKYCPFCGALMDNGDDLEEDVPDVDYEPIPF